MKLLYIGVHSHTGWGAEYWLEKAFSNLNIETELINYRKVRKAVKQPGTTFGDIESCKRWISEGYTMMSVPNALTIGTIGLEKILTQLREEFAN